MPSAYGKTVGAILVGLASALAARAAESFDAPERRATLAAGSVTRVRWTRNAASSEGVREMELLLSLDGGRTFGVRVTAEVEPQASEIEWRVPSLPSVHARLALRAGSGSRESERIVLVSEEFEIRASEDEPEEPVLEVETELRTREALAVRVNALPGVPSVASEPSISVLADGPPLASTARPPSLAPPTIAAVGPRPASPASPRPTAPCVESFPAAPLPLRL